MKLILTEHLKGLGNMGDLVEVANGYGRNYLIPRGLALPATGFNIKQIEAQKRVIIERKKKAEREAMHLKEALEKASIAIARQAGQDDKLFGSVTAANIAEALAEQDLKINKKAIHLEEPIKALGAFTVPIRLSPEIVAEVKVWVVKA